MTRAGVVALCACIVLLLQAGLCLAGSYQEVCGIPYTGANTNRGIAVNKNPGSPYYGYFYGVDSASAAIRIWKPDSGGTGATSYTNTGKKLSYATPPASTLFMHVFVGPDDTVWVVDYLAKQVCVGPPDGAAEGGNLTALPIALTYRPRSIFVTGNYGAAGTRVYVGEYESSAARKCEVHEFDGADWSLAADLGDLGLAQTWFVTVDNAGNSYWATFGVTAPQVKKVKPDFTVDTEWSFSKPAFFGTSWSVGGIAYAQDPTDPTGPGNLYVSAYNQTSCIRCDMDGSFIDGFGNKAGMLSEPPAGTWTTIPLSGPGGNSTVWLTADDQRNAYVLVTYPGTTVQAYKVHLQLPPAAPSALFTSNDVYGQIRLAWTPPAKSTDDPTGYRIYRGTAPGNETLYATTDSYPKWKDSVQGVQAGGPFYYYVVSYNGAGESPASNRAGPISPSASVAQAPRSLGVALSYSEVSKADTVNNPRYDSEWNLADKFLADRGIAYTEVWDADPSHLNIENDDIAGYSLLILASNRSVTSYSAQCIADYVKYSQGRVMSNYTNSIANHTCVRQSNFALKDIYRLNASTAGASGSPWVADRKYLYLRQIPTAPEAAAIFAGISGAPGWTGAKQWAFNDYLVNAYADGTASEVGKWYDADGAQSIADPNDVGLVIGYRTSARTDVQSVYTGGHWWSQAVGSFSGTRLLENILSFLGVSFTPYTGSLSVADAKLLSDANGVKLAGKVVTRQMMQTVFEPGPQMLTTTGVFYIQDPDVPNGIKVLLPPDYTVDEGDTVSIAGQITSDRVQTTIAGVTPVGYTRFERMITVSEMTTSPGATIPDPLYVGGKSVGGATMGPQLGVVGGVGLNNVGLLVTVVGSLKGSGMDMAGNFYFLIDDGSGYQIPSEPSPGIKVIGSAPTGVEGTMIRVTGVIGADVDYDGTSVIPVIRMRDFEVATEIPR